jgi:hypothetical protein
MVVTLKEVLDSLPPERRAEIDRRYEELVNEVESLKELRRLSALSQAKIAETLKISARRGRPPARPRAREDQVAGGCERVLTARPARDGPEAKRKGDWSRGRDDGKAADDGFDLTLGAGLHLTEGCRRALGRGLAFEALRRRHGFACQGRLLRRVRPGEARPEYSLEPRGLRESGAALLDALGTGDIRPARLRSYEGLRDRRRVRSRQLHVPRARCPILRRPGAAIFTPMAYQV